MKFVVRSRSELNRNGAFGAFLMIVGPMAVFASVLAYLNAPNPSGDSDPKFVLAILVAVALSLPFIGFVMFALGRETVSHAVSGDDAE